MNRRDFLQLSSTVTALAASGYMPLLAAPGKTRNIFTTPSAIEPITGALKKFTPAADSVSHDKYSIAYDLIRWRTAKGTNPSVNDLTGSLRIERTGSARNGRYTVAQTVKLPGPDQECFLNVDIQTKGELNEATKWSISGYQNEKKSSVKQPDSEIEFTGKKDGNSIVVSGGGIQLPMSVSEPLVPLWALPDTLAARLADGNHQTFQIAVLEDGFVIRPNQTLEYEGLIQVPCAAGTVGLHAWRHTGPGVLPIHWVLDDQGRTQLMTHSMVSWTLKEIS